MADYYSILKKTISGLADNTQETRNAVYGKARLAIERQLRAMTPVPPEEAISRQLQLLEAAITKLDNEFSPAPAAEPDTARDTPTDNPAPAPEPASPQPAPATAPPSPAPAPAPASPPPAVSAAQPESPVPAQQPAPAAASVDPATEQKSVEVAPPLAVDPVSVDPRGMDYSETILAQEPDTLGVVDDKYAERSSRSGFFSVLVPILLSLVVIGGGVYALWLNRDALIKGVLGDDSQPTVVSAQDNQSRANKPSEPNKKPDDGGAVDPEKVRVVGEEDKPKDSAKLTSDGETIKTTTPPSEPTASAQDPSETAPISENVEANIEEPEQATPQVTELDEDGQPTVKAPDTNGAESEGEDETAPEAIKSDEDKKSEDSASDVPAVAQKAYLYEEGTSGTNASRDNAAIIWSLEQQDVDGVREAVIKGQLDVPGRSLAMSLVIKRNHDASLPASHIIELQFQHPKDFSGVTISNVSRFVMKASEQGRGEGLIAVPAKISEGNFLIALNNLEQALATNKKLLIESTWIDVPLGYTTGRRALVTLEKGAIGDKVFRDAFADWDKR